MFTGRNIEWAIVDELYKAKAPKLLVLVVDEKPYPRGHPGFKYVAPAASIAFPPSLLLSNYLLDASYLPYRQMELFAASIFPRGFGLSREFDPVQYANTRTDYTTSFEGAGGKSIDMDREIPAAELEANYQREWEGISHSPLPKFLADRVEAADRVYVEEIARLATSRGSKLAFAYLPFFKGELDPNSRKYYEQFGTVLDNGDLANKSTFFSHWAHLNHAGAIVVSDRIADMVAAEL